MVCCGRRATSLAVVTTSSGPPLPDALAEKILQEAVDLSFDTLLAILPNFRKGNWDLRASYVDLAANNWSSKSVSPLTGCPDTAEGNLFKGAYFISRAWDARGSDLADKVAEHQWVQYDLALEMAQEALLRSAEQDTEDPTPYAYLTGPVATGLQVGGSKALEWFQAAVKRDPLNRMAHSGRLSCMCEKWGGSHEAMFAFASETCQKAPEDSKLRGVLLHAFYEQWLHYDRVTADRVAANVYLLDSKVREMTMTIYSQSFENHSIKDLSDCKSHMSVANWLTRLGERGAACNELNKLRPWKKVFDG